MEVKIRRHDLDWLRVIVFALLIFYHVGMFFVPWGWHIKNDITYDWLQWPMRFLNQWRLPILFVISGMGTYYALSKRSITKFSWERIKRLGIPLIFGMLIIVPPQVYFERLDKGQFLGSYWKFFTTIAHDGIYPVGNLSWHHLWFLPYLLIFSLLLGPIFVYLKKNKTVFADWLNQQVKKPFGLYLFILPLYLLEAFMEPFFDITHALVDDWFNFSFSLVLFFYGFVLISLGDTFWSSLKKIKTKALIIGVVAFLAQVFIWLFLEDGYVVHFTEALLKVANIWSWILVLFAYAATYLNKKSALLAYCNRAVYPFYILHQSITISIAFYLMHLNWGLFLKFTVLTLGTFLLSWFIYHVIILQIPLLHPFFGLKSKKTSAK